MKNVKVSVWVLYPESQGKERVQVEHTGKTQRWKGTTKWYRAEEGTGSFENLERNYSQKQILSSSYASSQSQKRICGDSVLQWVLSHPEKRRENLISGHPGGRHSQVQFWEPLPPPSWFILGPKMTRCWWQTIAKDFRLFKKLKSEMSGLKQGNKSFTGHVCAGGGETAPSARF